MYIYIFVLHLLAHGRKLILYFWGLCITEASSADQRYLQLRSQPWWMWMSVSDDECWCMVRRKRGWFLGKPGSLTLVLE